ncbi:transforming growth factor beta activator LRRC32 [Pyxicephalus adspersus]|uniref:Uncharacterized protein n=1 Tax=Pyxicephalus adspersus TaxID=30357 RepID=A0AAV3B2X1_PYXAD|nr:TPA: hypothetical protein GDO54_000199 [Pyxicephalus adspersus]
MVASCQNKSLLQVPLELHVGIRSLNLSRNNLKNITKNPLSYYSFLEFLDLSSNKINFIEPNTFVNMVHLKEINLSDNNLDRFAFKSPGLGLLPNVQKLDLSRNSLYTDMSGSFIQNAPNLRYLSLAGNSIIMISQETFSGTPLLSEVDLHNNIIMDIEEGSFDHLVHLRKINLVMNSITCISKFNLHQLESLNLGKNSIRTFHTLDSEEEYYLKHVDLSDNKLVHFPILPTVNNLMTLNLSMNLISFDENSSHDELAWLEEEEPSRNTTMVNFFTLTHLDLSYNNIKSIPEDFFSTMPMLKFINLSQNCMEYFSFGNVVALNFLEELDLSGNSIQNMSLASISLPNLKILHLQNNQLQFVESKIFQRLPSIKYINLQSNNVELCGLNSEMNTENIKNEKCLSFFNISSLQHLNLRENMLKVIPERAFYGTSLTFLDVSRNFGLVIRQNALKGLERSLEVLHLEESAIFQLNVDLPLLVHLRYLNLSGNSLTWLPTWNRNCQLETLDLSNNSFSNLKDSNIPILENTLKTLSLTGNPLSCCENSWIIHMVRRNTVTINHLDATMCFNSNGQKEEIILGQASLENCENNDVKNTNTVIILTVVLVSLVTAIGVGSLACYCRQKLNQQFKA